MKMKTLRKLMKNPPYKHTCGCMTADCHYLVSLPKVQEDCVDCRYWKRVGDDWIDVTDTVPKSDSYDYMMNN